MADNGAYRYASISRSDGNISNKLLTVLNESFVSCDYANNIVVVKTLPGMAWPRHRLSMRKWPDIVGTIAGDDTIMIVCRAEDR